MSEEEALMGAVLASPDEDTPRLALADWWDEHGDKNGRKRAELTRVQYELLRIRQSPDEWTEADVIRAEKLKKRQRALVKQIKWPGVPRGARVQCGQAGEGFRLEVERGHITTAWGSAVDWFEHSATLLKHHPVRLAVLTGDIRLTFVAKEWPKFWTGECHIEVMDSPRTGSYSVPEGTFAGVEELSTRAILQTLWPTVAVVGPFSILWTAMVQGDL